MDTLVRIGLTIGRTVSQTKLRPPITGIGPPCNNNPLHEICSQQDVFTWQGKVVVGILVLLALWVGVWCIRQLRGR